jgi:hypothetical protein
MKITSYPSRPKQPHFYDNYEKGRLFEGSIKRLFNERNFRLDKWHESRRIVDHYIPVSFTYPDLELVFFIGRKQYRFAVECKWRQTFWNGKIDWAEPHQIDAYEYFQRQQRIPVFIAIGIGGSPSRPEKLFVTPLSHISHTTEVYESDLILYKRKPQHRLFYDAIQPKLF